MKYEENRNECDKQDKHEIKIILVDHFLTVLYNKTVGLFCFSPTCNLLLLPCCLVHLLSLFSSFNCIFLVFVYEKAEPWKKKSSWGLSKHLFRFSFSCWHLNPLNQIKFHLNVLNLGIGFFFFGVLVCVKKSNIY